MLPQLFFLSSSLIYENVPILSLIPGLNPPSTPPFYTYFFPWLSESFQFNILFHLSFSTTQIVVFHKFLSLSQLSLYSIHLPSWAVFPISWQQLCACKLLPNPSVQFHSLGASHKSPLCIMVLHRTKFLVYLIWMTTVVFVKYKFFKRLLSIYSYYKIPELQNIPQTSLSPSYIQHFVPLFPYSVLPFPPLPTVTLVCSQYLWGVLFFCLISLLISSSVFLSCCPLQSVFLPASFSLLTKLAKDWSVLVG
mgnify:CR=1 FL=1